MGSLEKRYAEALLSLAESAPQADEIDSALNALGQMFLQNQELRDFILNPAISKQTRGETIMDILDMLNASNGNEPGSEAILLLSRFLKLLLEKGRLAFLPNIAEEFHVIKAAHRNMLRITVRSASALDDDILDELREKYRIQYGAAQAEIENVTAPSIIGGISVQIGDVRIDDTIYGRLASLARTIASGAVFKKLEK